MCRKIELEFAWRRLGRYAGLANSFHLEGNLHSRLTGQIGEAMNSSMEVQDQPVIDLDGLKARCLGNLNLVERVLAKFETQLDSDLAALELAVMEGDTNSAAQVAHRIKGMSANVEARDLFHSAMAIEQLAKGACVTEMPKQLLRIQNDRARITESLKKTNASAI
jgi:HPt (histidine-containing phosphotransfer) domain-containing protein